jgi:hypothetical protein
VWLVGGLTTFWAVVSTVVLLWPGLGVDWFGQTGSPDATLPAGFTRWQFELTELVPTALLVGLGLVFYALGRSTREQALDIPFSEEAGIAPSQMPVASS